MFYRLHFLSVVNFAAARYSTSLMQWSKNKLKSFIQNAEHDLACFI